MAKLARIRGIPAELAVVALVAAASLPMTRLFSAGSTGSVILMCIALSAGVSWLTRKLRLPAFIAVVISIACMIWFIAVRFFPTTLWGPFPSGATFSAMLNAAHEGARQINIEVAPVTPTGPLLMFVAAGVWLTVWLVDTATISVTNPLLGVASTIPLFIVPGGLLASKRLAFESALFVAGAALLLFTSERGRAEHAARGTSTGAERSIGWRPGPAARVAVVALLLMVFVTPVLPGFGGVPVFRAHGNNPFGVRFNPLVMVKPTLDNKEDVPLFTVVSSQPLYYRLTALDHFDGKTFSQARRDDLVSLDGRIAQLNTAGLTSDTTPVTQSFTIDRLAGPWLPAAYDPAQLLNVDSAKYEPDTNTLLIADGLRGGMQYAVRSLVPQVTPQELDTAVSFDDPFLKPYLALPGDTPENVKTIAHQLTDGQSTPFRKAVAIQDYLRGFTYDENVAQGHSFANMEQFLTKAKRGYCEQFAATMAVLARIAGLPSRVVIGFAPGKRIAPETYLVTTRYAHAWVEIYFPQAGWLTFEPTPRSSIVQVPAYTSIPNPVPNPSTSVDPSSTANPRASSTKRFNDPTGPARGSAPASVPAWAYVLGALVLLAGAAWGGARLVRARRARALAEKPVRDAVTLRYIDFLDWCRATGYGREPGETPREHAARIGRRVTAASPSLDSVAAMAEAALWAPPNGLVAGEAERVISQARAALAEPLSRRARARGAVRFTRN